MAVIVAPVLAERFTLQYMLMIKCTSLATGLRSAPSAVMYCWQDGEFRLHLNLCLSNCSPRPHHNCYKTPDVLATICEVKDDSSFNPGLNRRRRAESKDCGSSSE